MMIKSAERESEPEGEGLRPIMDTVVYIQRGIIGCGGRRTRQGLQVLERLCAGSDHVQMQADIS